MGSRNSFVGEIRNEVIRAFDQVRVVFIPNRDDDPVARLHFLDVVQNFFVALMRRPAEAGSYAARNTTGRFSSISAFGPCFISPAGIAFRVNVRKLLQLERAFQRNREMDARAPGTENRDWRNRLSRSLRCVSRSRECVSILCGSSVRSVSAFRFPHRYSVPCNWPR